MEVDSVVTKPEISVETVLNVQLLYINVKYGGGSTVSSARAARTHGEFH